LAKDPQATARFERLVYRTKLAILLLALASGACAAWDLEFWTLLGFDGGLS
jgi:hypothetical protein